jgi:hypothetical protein
MAWLYIERGEPAVAGPFTSLENALDSLLWERDGVCLWIEAYVQGKGWFYENVKWCGDHWLVTSRGVRPVEPFRPIFIFDQSGHVATS